MVDYEYEYLKSEIKGLVGNIRWNYVILGLIIPAAIYITVGFLPALIMLCIGAFIASVQV
jgi:hypothetical protein